MENNVGGNIMLKLKIKYLVCGLVIGLLCANVSVFALNKTLKQAYFNDIKITVDGQELVLNTPVVTVETNEDAAGFTYVPARQLAEALGAKVDWDNKNKAVIVTSNALTTSTTEQTDLSDLYPVKIDPETGKIIGAEEIEYKGCKCLLYNDIIYISDTDLVMKFGFRYGYMFSGGICYTKGENKIFIYNNDKTNNIYNSVGTIYYKIDLFKDLMGE
jgi:hypothetical protein